MLSKKERAVKAAATRWGKKSIAEGVIRVGDVMIDCYVLNTKERVVSTPSLHRAFDMKAGGYKTGDRRIVRFVKTEGMLPYVKPELLNMLENPVSLKTLGKGRTLAYPAEVVSKLCSAILDAGTNGTLKAQQMHIARQAKVLLDGFATVGVIGLIDEATGYQYVRERNALAEVLEEFVAKEAAVWAKKFPDDFYEELFRLQNINTNEKPWRFGKITNDIIYRRLAPGVLTALEKKNPRDERGNRHQKHHQWLTKEAQDKLKHHLGRVTGLMMMSKNWKQFMMILDKKFPVYPQIDDSIKESGIAGLGEGKDREK